MNYGKMFDMLDSIPSPGNNNQYPGMNTPTPYEPTFYDQPPVTSWEDAFTGFKTRPVLYNMDGWISPYASNNWGGTSNILQYIDDQSRLPTVEQKIDPNKIFSSELNGLRALAADQQKVVKMFERKLMENLTEKGKIGLTEEDIEAMSALTAARSAITSISKEQVAIKKNIADIRIKQAQNNGPVAGGQNGPVDKPFASMDIGRSILDSIFDAPTSSPSIPTTNVEYSAATAGDAGRVLDSLVPTAGDRVSYESAEPTTYVVVGDTDDDVEFATYSATGDLIPDFPHPDAKITSIDREAHKAVDQYLVEYPIKEK